jgi:hypothetical protein
VVSFTPWSLYPRGKRPRYPLGRKLGGPRASLDNLERRKFLTLLGLELRSLGRPARSQSLYRLSYPGSSSPNEVLENVNLQLHVLIFMCRLFKKFFSYRNNIAHYNSAFRG